MKPSFVMNRKNHVIFGTTMIFANEADDRIINSNSNVATRWRDNFSDHAYPNQSQVKRMHSHQVSAGPLPVTLNFEN
jgi:hypothetical protein